MHLKQTKRGDRVYLSVVQNYRVGGKTKTRTVESLGYVDELAADFDDPVAHFRAYVDELNERRRASDGPISFSIARDAQIGEDEAGSVQLGVALALAYYDAFGVGAFLRGQPRVQVPQGRPDRVFELLSSARMVHAAPKHETWDARASFPRSCPGDYADVYRALPVFAREGSALVRHLNAAYVRLRGPRNLRRVTLVLSNYVFPWSRGYTTGSLPDEGEQETLRRLCITIDGDGIPLGYRIVASEFDAEQAEELVDDVREAYGAQTVTLVASRLADWERTARHLVATGDSLVTLLPDEQEGELAAWIADDAGYEDFHGGAYQVKSTTITVPPGHDGRTITMRRLALRGPNLTGASRLAARSASQARATRSAICIASTLTDASDAFNFNIYRELWRVHEPFQVEAADFVSMPYAVPAEQHLEAHFVICYVAFFLMRVMRRDIGWRYNAVAVSNALGQLEGTYLAENWYLFSYRSEVTDAIEESMGIDVGRRILSRSDVRSLIVAARANVTRPR